MDFSINYNEEKNQLLQATRGISFEDVIVAMSEGKLLADKKHQNEKYHHQRVFVVQINDYAYAVPYVINIQKKEIFLKTVFPSRILTKKYLRGEL